MNEKNRIVNTTAVDGKTKDRVLNNYPQTPVEKLTALLQKVKAQHQELKKGEYFGWSLFSTRLTIEEFVSMYPGDSAFTKEIINLAGKNSVNLAGHFTETRVQVPELTGMLPMPDFGILTNRTMLLNEQKSLLSNQQERDENKIKQVSNKLKKIEKDALREVLKMNLFPRAYYYSEDNSLTDRGRLCKIKFTDSLPTKGVAILLEEMDDYFEIEFET